MSNGANGGFQLSAGQTAGLGVVGLGATVAGMLASEAEADYNATLARLQGEIEQKAFYEESRRLGEEQRELKASQRVALAAGGAGMGQEQSLMLLGDQANKMQLDQIELRKRGRIAKALGESRSLIAKMKGKERRTKGFAQLSRQTYGLGKEYEEAKTREGNADIGSQFSYDFGLGAKLPNYLRRK